MQRNELISRNAVIEEFYKYIGSEFCVDDIRFIEKIIMGVPGIKKPEHEADFCEIIQMKCPYDHDCRMCRLHSDYEKAREKSEEICGDKKPKLRVWHIPQVPMEFPFEIEVSSIEEAWKILNILWEYDLFQYENNLKPDYCNTSGLEYFDEEEKDWMEWEDEDGYSIREHFNNLEED